MGERARRPPSEAADAAPSPLEDLSWVWVPGEDATNDATGGSSVLPQDVHHPGGQGHPAGATFSLTADDQFRLFVNGHDAGGSDGSMDAWRRPEMLDVAKACDPGENTLADLRGERGRPRRARRHPARHPLRPGGK